MHDTMSYAVTLLILPYDVCRLIFRRLELEDLFSLWNCSKAIRSKMTEALWKELLRELLRSDPGLDLEVVRARIEAYFQRKMDSRTCLLALYPMERGISNKYVISPIISLTFSQKSRHLYYESFQRFPIFIRY